MQSEQDAREIAEKLTRAMIDTLLNISVRAPDCDGNGVPWITFSHQEKWMNVKALNRRALVTLDFGGEGAGARSQTRCRITNLGRSVASHLQRKSPS